MDGVFSSVGSMRMPGQPCPEPGLTILDTCFGDDFALNQISLIEEEGLEDSDSSG